MAQHDTRIERARQLWHNEKIEGGAESAAKLLDPIAEAGSPEAQTLMGEIRQQGKTPESLRKALNWYARAALQEYPSAQLRLSQLLRSGTLPEVNAVSPAPLDTAILAGQKDNAAAAEYWLERAANLGDADAQYSLGQMFEGAKKFPQAVAWYEKAAQQNNPAALNALAVLLWQGEVVVKNVARAAQLCQQAAALGYAPAMFNVAGLIAQQQIPGAAPQMIAWLRQSAAQGYANAQLQLARMLLYGEQIAQNEAEAAGLFRQAAQQGLPWGDYYLGILLQKGRGVNRDFDASRQAFERAAHAGIIPAQYELGWIYQQGFGIPSDAVKAKQLIQQAADAGLPEAKKLLQQITAPSTPLAPSSVPAMP